MKDFGDQLDAIMQYECAVELLKQEVPDITDEEIEEITSIYSVKTNWCNAVLVYRIMKASKC